MDCGIDMIPDNYWKYVEQYSPETTSSPAWRLGPTNQFLGRFAREFKITDGQGEMFFSVPDEWDNSGDNDCTISVSYLDTGTGIFSVNCATCIGKTEIAVIQKTNTNLWVTKDINHNILINHSLEHGSDVTIKYHSGDNTQFGLLEFKNNSILIP